MYVLMTIFLFLVRRRRGLRLLMTISNVLSLVKAFPPQRLLFNEELVGKAVPYELSAYTSQGLGMDRANPGTEKRLAEEMAENGIGSCSRNTGLLCPHPSQMIIQNQEVLVVGKVLMDGDPGLR